MFLQLVIRVYMYAIALACTVAGHKTGNRLNIAAVSSLTNQLDPQTDQ